MLHGQIFRFSVSRQGPLRDNFVVFDLRIRADRSDTPVDYDEGVSARAIPRHG
jgi:hypothetical protein